MAAGLSDHYVYRVIAARSTNTSLSLRADRRPVQRLLSLVTSFASGAPLQSALFDGRDVMQQVRELVEQWKPAAVIVLTERLPASSAGLCSVSLIVDIVDSMRIHMEERAARAGVLSRLLWKREAQAFARHAKSLARCATYVVAASDTALVDYPNARVITNAARADLNPRPPSTIDVVFTGNLSYWPNVKAAIEVCERIAPRIRRALPQATIVVAGRDPSAAVRRACATARVTLLPNVEDMASVIRASRLALAPVAWTPGANLKILEALAAGTPVFAYPSAARQVPDSDGVVICDGPESMSRAAIAFLEGRDVHIVTNREQHTWTARAAQLEALLDTLP
jgi:glycosyltransferase involved in cell wall biosynthesis